MISVTLSSEFIEELKGYVPGFSTTIIVCCVALFGVLFAIQLVNLGIKNKLMLVTDNIKDFEQLDGIKIENWFKRKV